MLGYCKSLRDFNLKGKKIFISQPMKGKTEVEIRNERKNLVEEIEKNGGEVIDSVFTEFDETTYKTTPLVYLAESIRLLAKADIAIFMPGYYEARGCRIEFDCCQKYDIDCIVV